MEKRYLGHTDLPILQSEVKRLDPLKEFFQACELDFVYCSDLRRCVETKEYLELRSKQEVLTPLLREFHFGSWEGKSFAELKDEPTYQKWLSDQEDCAPPDGETSALFSRRIDQFLNQLYSKLEEENQILICTHGGVIRRLLTKWIPSTPFWEWEVPHGSLYKLTLHRKGQDWTCGSWSVVPTQEKEEL